MNLVSNVLLCLALALTAANSALAAAPSSSDRDQNQSSTEQPQQPAQNPKEENLDPSYEERWKRNQKELGDRHPFTISSLESYANALRWANRLQEAEPLLAQVVRLRKEVTGPRKAITASAVVTHAMVLANLGHSTKAIPLFAEAWNISHEAAGESDFSTLNNLHLYIYTLSAVGRYREAAPLQAELWRLHREKFGEDSREALSSMGEYARILNAAGRLGEAAPLYEKSWRNANATLGPDHPETMTRLNNHALFLSKIGQSLEAEKYMSEVLQAMRRKWGEKHEAKINALGNYAAILIELGRIEEAGLIIAEASDLSREILGDMHDLTLTSLNSQALNLNRLGRTEAAEKIMAEVLQSRKKTLGEKHPETINAMDGYAPILADLQRQQEAVTLQREALRLSYESLGEKHPDTVRILNNYASLMGKMGRSEEVLSLRTKALKIGREVFGPASPRIWFLELQQSRDMLRRPGRSHLAIEPARLAVSSIQKTLEAAGLNPAAEAQADRNAPSEADYFKTFADAAWASRPDRASQASSNDRARQDAELGADVFEALQNIFRGSANKAVALAAARKISESRSKALAELAIQREQLSNQWVAADQELVSSLANIDPDSEARRTNLRDTKAVILSEMEIIDARLRKEVPEYFNFIRPQPLSLAEAKALVGKEDAALLVVPSEFGTHIMAVTDEGLAWRRSDWTAKEIQQAVQRLLWDVGANVEVSPVDAAKWGDEGEGAYPFDRHTAHMLYNQIIAPVAKHLDGKRHLYIAASGSLSSMPFGMLVSSPPSGSDGDPDVLRATSWFADDHALVQIPSLQSLSLFRKINNQHIKQRHDIEFQGFGDPLLNGKAAGRAQRNLRQWSRTGSALVNTEDLRKLARLPGTAREINALGDAFGASPKAIFLGERATERNIRTINLADTRILALATHGLVAGEVRGANEPGLVFTPPQIADEDDNGLLTASEITGLTLNAEWVILSACNTATGDGSEGAPGLSGLARSFFYAGARNLLASHWPVRDAVAPKISVRTVEIFRDNPELTRAEAFQQAIREVRNDRTADSETDTWAHPNAWAPFSLIGDR
ncbi:CHAT domain-containing protein [Parasphingorhabdus litoris]|uniref:CHAT domain-containing protein n=1 Tax=Parasphingorhabdus litoris TaxID=394733 RepID=A0ABP3KEU6_9SPHN|nr:CHAT domain-containing tetratricopeptide repeat protein [Parasphingorhabdus litoris]